MQQERLRSKEFTTAKTHRIISRNSLMKRSSLYNTFPHAERKIIPHTATLTNDILMPNVSQNSDRVGDVITDRFRVVILIRNME